MIWVTIIAALIPLLVKLIEYLRNRKKPLTDRQKAALNKVLRHCAELRRHAVSMGCHPEGEE